jgi:cyclin A
MDMDEDSIFDDIDDFDQLEDPIEINEPEPETPPAPVRDPAQECYEYANDIYKHMRTMENRYLPKPNYMRENQQDINASMRGILVDWLNEVCQEYKLKTETLYLAVNIADRTLSHFPIPRNKLQMVGVTSLFISAKYNELSPPTVDDFVFITDNTYPKAEILQMETHILNALEFNITVVTSIDFLVRFLRSVNATETCYSLAFVSGFITVTNGLVFD